MPVIAGSAVSAITTPPATGFTPTGVFVVRVLSGFAQLEVQLPGSTDWLAVGDMRWPSLVSPVWQEGKTAVAVVPDIAGSSYRLSPQNGTPLTADAWSA
jgi:hypothetical protein